MRSQLTLCNVSLARLADHCGTDQSAFEAGMGRRTSLPSRQDNFLRLHLLVSKITGKSRHTGSDSRREGQTGHRESRRTTR
ncbi:hypothetical protein J6590_068075 [Homalodisca vitripennis]|nr:hypothetical protein J6590_068075 [Homalodisca vitripennis]